MAGMIEFLRQLWKFVHPYRGRFYLGLFCGICYGLVNGVLLGTVKVVVELVLTISWPVLIFPPVGLDFKHTS
jgi:ammonia channel protein AmtB